MQLITHYVAALAVNMSTEQLDMTGANKDPTLIITPYLFLPKVDQHIPLRRKLTNSFPKLSKVIILRVLMHGTKFITSLNQETLMIYPLLARVWVLFSTKTTVILIIPV